VGFCVLPSHIQFIVCAEPGSKFTPATRLPASWERLFRQAEILDRFEEKEIDNSAGAGLGCQHL
jgi:hypothetical protein